MSTERKKILSLLELHSEGLSLAALSGHFSFERRTLLRRLNSLIGQKLLLRIGQGSQVIYKLNKESSHIPGSLILSSASLGIQSLVNTPVTKRKSVGYQNDFLEHYQPNQSFYLTESERKHLHRIGAQEGGNQPVGTFARKILDRFLIDLTWNSSRLEGNTYSLLETEELIHHGKVAEGKGTMETQMILNHKAAIEFLVEFDRKIFFDKFTICNLHGLLSDNLLNNPDACGRIRNIAVGISGSAYKPLDIPQKIGDFLEDILKKASKIKDAFEQSFFILVHLPYLQPFEDVNKRVSRLSANIPFINKNYCPLSFVDMPEKNYVEGLLGVYELNKVDLLKDVFLWAYERSTQRYAKIRRTLGEPDPFRLQYRNFAQEIIHQILKEAMSKTKAISYLRARVGENIPSQDQFHFIEMVETELLALHEGNFARYKITPNEFQIWKKQW